MAWSRYRLLLAVLAAAGTVLVLLRNAAWGPGLLWDSVNYISVARSLLAGEGFIQFSGHLYNFWPPLYPLLLAAFSLPGFDPHTVAGPLNVFMFGLTILVAGHWLRQRIASRPLFLWACLAVAFALPLTSISSWALSEPAFILFVALALFYMDRFLRDDQQRGALIWAGLFTALACLTRYIGLVVVMALLPLVFLQPGVRLSQKVKRGAVYALISIMPISLWLLRNLLRVGAPFGTLRPPDGDPLRRFLRSGLTELADWALPGLSSSGLRLYAAALVAALLVALGIAVGLTLIRMYREPILWRRWSSFCLCGSYVLVYLAWLGISSTVKRIPLEDERYWVVIYIPLLFVLAFLLDRFVVWRRKSHWARVALGILLFIWLGNSLRLNIQAVARASAGDDRGYAAPLWKDNDVTRFIRQAQLKGTIFANKLANLYIHTDPTNDYRQLPLNPHRGQTCDLSCKMELLAPLKRRIEQTVRGGGDGYLVWWHDHINWKNDQYGYGPSELETLLELELVARLDDGIIFRVKRDL